MTTALITGGCGFIGSHLAESLLKEGAQVLIVDNFCTSLRENLSYLQKLPQAKTHLYFIEADVSSSWKDWLPKNPIKQPFTHVFHFASPASPPHYQRMSLETMRVNSQGLLEALQFANSQKGRLIFASTSEVYGDPQISPQPETYWGNVNPVGIRSCYDESKRFGESLIYTMNLRDKTQHGIVRIFNTYGPRMNPQDGRVVINFLCQALRNEDLTVYGDGSQSRSFCYIDDLVAGILAFARSLELGPINLGNDSEFTILDLAHNVQKIFKDKDLKIKQFPLPGDDPKIRRPDLGLARSALKWEPKIPLEEGLRKMLSWLEKQKITL